MVKCVVECVVGCVTECMVERVVKCVFECMVGCMIECVVECMVKCVIKCMFECMVECMIKCMIGCMVECVVECMVKCVIQFEKVAFMNRSQQAPELLSKKGLTFLTPLLLRLRSTLSISYRWHGRSRLVTRGMCSSSPRLRILGCSKAEMANVRS